MSELLQPIENEGLGMRRLVDQNKSFLLQLGLQLVVNNEALWVRVLHTKYKMCEGCLESISPTACSSIWRSFSKVWSCLRENIYWSLGDGPSPFRTYDATRYNLENVAVQPPAASLGYDMLLWGDSESGGYTLKEAYNTLSRDKWEANDHICCLCLYNQQRKPANKQ